MNDTPKPLKIDILKMELEQKLPHWLSPHQKEPEKYAAIREKNRAKWRKSLEDKGNKGR